MDAARTSFRSRFARRLLLLFAGCALAPMGVLAALVLTHTADQLERQAQARLQQASKSVGLAVLERISLLEREARLAVERLERSRTDPAVLAETAGHFEALARVEPDGVQPLLGQVPPLPALDPTRERHLADGGSALFVQRARNGRVRILLLAPLGAAGAPRLLASLDVDHVVAPAAVHSEGPGTEYCLLASADTPIACSFAGGPQLPEDLGDRLAEAVSGPLAWRHDGEAYLARHWSLFLKARFASPSWTVVLAEPRSLVVGPMEDFKRFLVLVVLGSMCCVLLLAIGQIRRSLVPLQRLRTGARRIARRDFDARVDAASADEFQEVADAFNGMAETLGRQFSALVAIDEIDRAVLSSMDSTDIVDTVLARLGDVHPCDLLAFIELDPADPRCGRAAVRDLAAPTPAPHRTVTLSGADLEALRRSPRAAFLETARAPDYLRPLAEAGACFVQVLPIWVGDQPRGVLAAGHRQAPPPEASDTTYARQIADQAAVGLANADMIAEIRELNRSLEDKVRARTAELSAALEALREAQARLVHREKMASVGQLVAGVAHELNNPLNFIQGNLTFLRRHADALAKAVSDYEDVLAHALPDGGGAVAGVRERHDLDFVTEDLASILDACREGAERSAAIVADLQSFSRLDGGDAREADLHEGLDQTLSILACRLADVEVVHEYGEIPAVECLAGQVQQVFMNLIVNAADAVAEGEGARITVRTSAPDPDTVRVEVEDDGCGIPDDIRERIFDPFFTTKEVGRGTGLGLAIAFGVVSRHAGRIEVDSEVGRGSRFRVELPVKFDPQSTEQQDRELPLPGADVT